MKRAMLSHIKARACASHGARAAALARFADIRLCEVEVCQKNERLGTQQVMLRGNRRGVALPGPHAYSSKVSRSCNFIASHNPSFLNSFTCSIRIVSLGTQQVKLRGNRRGVASRMKLFMSTAQRYHEPATSQHRKIIPRQCHILMVYRFCEPCAWQAELPR